MEAAALPALVWAKATLVWGLFVWMALNVVNHFADLGGMRHGVAAFMRMESLDQPPPIPTPLKSRRIDSAALHTLAVVVVIVLQAISALLFAWSGWWFARGDVRFATSVGLWAFTWFAAIWLLFIAADTWFVAWLRQDALQRTHLLLLLLAVAGSMLMAV
jgi:hypothetical protein